MWIEYASREGDRQAEVEIVLLSIEYEVEFLEVGPSDSADPCVNWIYAEFVLHEQFRARETHLLYWAGLTERKHIVYAKVWKCLNRLSTSSSSNLLDSKDLSEKSRTVTSFQMWRHLRPKMLVWMEVLVGRKDRMWLSKQSGRLLILSSFFLIFAVWSSTVPLLIGVSLVFRLEDEGYIRGL